jgi:hypothetical protein
MTRIRGSILRSGLLAGLAVALPSLAHAQVTLWTASAPRYSGGAVKCSAVDVGFNPLAVTVTLIDVDGVDAPVTTKCDGSSQDNPALQPTKRCVATSDSTSAAIVYCTITVDIVGGSDNNPAVAALRQQVRGNITSISPDSDSFVVQAAE